MLELRVKRWRIERVSHKSHIRWIYVSEGTTKCTFLGPTTFIVVINTSLSASIDRYVALADCCSRARIRSELSCSQLFSHIPRERAKSKTEAGTKQKKCDATNCSLLIDSLVCCSLSEKVGRTYGWARLRMELVDVRGRRVDIKVDIHHQPPDYFEQTLITVKRASQLRHEGHQIWLEAGAIFASYCLCTLSRLPEDAPRIRPGSSGTESRGCIGAGGG